MREGSSLGPKGRSLLRRYRWDVRAAGRASTVAPPDAAPLYAWLAARTRATFLRSVLPSLAPGAVLDVGCGKGLWLRLLASRGFAVTGVDLSWPMLRRARAAAACVQMDATHLSFTSRAFDNVLAVTVLQHVPRAEEAIAELARVARRRIAVYELTSSLVPRCVAPHVFVRLPGWYQAAFSAHGWALRASFEVPPLPPSVLRFGPRALAHLAARHTWLIFGPAFVDAKTVAG